MSSLGVNSDRAQQCCGGDPSLAARPPFLVQPVLGEPRQSRPWPIWDEPSTWQNLWFLPRSPTPSDTVSPHQFWDKCSSEELLGVWSGPKRGDTLRRGALCRRLVGWVLQDTLGSGCQVNMRSQVLKPFLKIRKDTRGGHEEPGTGLACRTCCRGYPGGYSC